MRAYDPSAVGSDIPRSRKQYVARKIASFLIAVLRLNRPGFLSTEIVQQIYPICTIATKFGVMRCKCGHGRLRWRAATFYSEEPETVKWLESLDKGDLLWDIGANVGLYSIYAAKFSKCKVLAIEPEAQNYATLIENIVLNNLQEDVDATNLAIAGSFGVGKLYVHAITKGGAYNQFALSSVPQDLLDSVSGLIPIGQVQIGVSLDDLINRFDFQYPTHIKIDVDGNEPDIIFGASQVLKNERCKSVLLEVQRNEPDHIRMLERLDEFGYCCTSQRSNWESRTHREKESECPATNMIFYRG